MLEGPREWIRGKGRKREEKVQVEREGEWEMREKEREKEGRVEKRAAQEREERRKGWENIGSPAPALPFSWF